MNLNSKDLVYKTELDSLDLICVCIRKGSDTSFMILERQYYKKEDIEAMNPDEYSVSDLKYNKKEGCYNSV